MNTYQDNYIFCSPLLGVGSLEAKASVMDDGSVNPFEITDPSQDIERAATLDEIRTALHTFINSRSKRERAIIEMVYFNNMTRKTCADALGISPAAVTKTLKRVFESARETLSCHHDAVFA